MATMLDAAKYILQSAGEMTAMKLQKLMYYAQAWSLVWDEEPLFEDDFEAWANGPVLPALYGRHKGQFKVSVSIVADGNEGALSPEQRQSIDKVLGFYGQQSAQWLSNLTHQERPWVDARAGIPDGEPCSATITKLAMHEYYSSL